MSEQGLHEEAPKWATWKQRDDLKPCPFCGTMAIEQVKMWRTENRIGRRISCGNPFCELECRTQECAALADAEEFWETRV